MEEQLTYLRHCMDDMEKARQAFDKDPSVANLGYFALSSASAAIAMAAINGARLAELEQRGR